jgi:hypothetical protein
MHSSAQVAQKVGPRRGRSATARTWYDTGGQLGAVYEGVPWPAIKGAGNAWRLAVRHARALRGGWNFATGSLWIRTPDSMFAQWLRDSPFPSCAT